MVMVALVVNTGEFTVFVPVGPKTTCKFPPPRL
jgi:hypothetical protein